MRLLNIFSKKEAPDYIVCPTCGRRAERQDIVANNYICTFCGHYYRVRTNNRIKMVVDPGSFTPWFANLEATNPLDFPGYDDKLKATREKTGLDEGVTVGECRIGGEKAVIGVCDSRFLMGSMGHVYGEKITLAVEKATELKLPVIIFTCSGGARMQEGIISLMQMEKTSAALKRHADAGLLYIPVLTDPTTGGVTASFAMLGDIILAEPGALVGFAGPRVIEQTIGQKLPDGFQRSEFILEHGFCDAIVERKDLKETLTKILKITNGTLPANPKPRHEDKGDKKDIVPLSAWDKVKAVRSIKRPSALAYINTVFDDFIEFHGDRYYADDKCVVGGIATLNGKSVTVIGVEKGQDMAECKRRNFGMPSPEGYRKALRLMKQAEKFNRPVITFVNTPGAFPGMEAEENGQGEAIARNLFEMSGLKIPVLALMIGEGGSGGALGLAVGNEVWMMENATYSVLSPEGFASILWKDGKRAAEAAGVMCITAEDLKRLGVIERIIPEYGEASDETITKIADYLKDNIAEFIKKYEGMTGNELADQRYQRFRKY